MSVLIGVISGFGINLFTAEDGLTIYFWPVIFFFAAFLALLFGLNMRDKFSNQFQIIKNDGDSRTLSNDQILDRAITHKKSWPWIFLLLIICFLATAGSGVYSAQQVNVSVAKKQKDEKSEAEKVFASKIEQLEKEVQKANQSLGATPLCKISSSVKK